MLVSYSSGNSLGWQDASKSCTLYSFMQNVDMYIFILFAWRKYLALSKRLPPLKECIKTPSRGEESKEKMAVG